MPKHVPTVIRAQIVALREAGLKFKQISDQVGCSIGSCSIVVKNYKETASYVSKKAPGKKRKLNARDERQIRRMVEKDRKMSCKKQTVLFNSLSDKTISEITMRRTLKRLGFRGRAAARKILLKAKHRSTRRK